MAEPVEQVELLTLSRLWLFERYLFRFMDRPLASPWRLRLLALAVPTFAAVFALLAVFTPFTPTGAAGTGLVPYLLLPGVLVWWALTRLSAGAKLDEVVLDHTRLMWHLRREPAPLRPTCLSSVSSGPTIGHARG